MEVHVIVADWSTDGLLRWVRSYSVWDHLQTSLPAKLSYFHIGLHLACWNYNRMVLIIQQLRTDQKACLSSFFFPWKNGEQLHLISLERREIYKHEDTSTGAELADLWYCIFLLPVLPNKQSVSNAHELYLKPNRQAEAHLSPSRPATYFLLVHLRCYLCQSHWNLTSNHLNFKPK